MKLLFCLEMLKKKTTPKDRAKNRTFYFWTPNCGLFVGL